MRTIEELQAQQAKELAELQRQHAIAASMAEVPYMVTIQGKRAAWVSYKCKAIADVIRIFSGFADAGRVVNMELRKGTFTTLQPLSEFTAKELERSKHQGDYCMQLDVNHGEGYGPFAKFAFYVSDPKRGQVLRIVCDLDPHGHSRGVHQFHPVIAKVAHDRSGRVIERKYGRNDSLNGHADHVLKFGTYEGAIEKSSDFRYLWVADDAECTEFSHVLGALENMAGEFNL